MESERPNDSDHATIWHLPIMGSNRLGPALMLDLMIEMSDSSTTGDIQSWIQENMPDSDLSFPVTVFSFPREPSPESVEIKLWATIDREGDEAPGKLLLRFEVFYKDNYITFIPRPRSEMVTRIRMDMEMEYHASSSSGERGASNSDGHMLIETEHEPDKDLNLLIAAYLSMNANVSASNRDFIVPDLAIYKQRTPQGNTVLHLAAIYGDNAMVEKVAQNAPHLFIATNNNHDTALHVAARAGQAPTVQFLLNAFLSIVRRETNPPNPILELLTLVSLSLLRNNQGNTIFHEAFMVDSHNGAMIFEAPFVTDSSEFESTFKDIVHYLATFATNKEGKTLLYLAIEVGCKQVVNQLMDICVKYELKPEGKSPILPAIIKKDIEMIETMLSKKPNWIHLSNEEGRFPLHHAASMGYLEGVSYFVKKCASCTMVKDKVGFFPLHLACIEGHVEVIQELLKSCPDPTEMLDQKGQNFLHIAAKSGKYEVVRYILQHPKLEKMINQKDNDGNTPLHWATFQWHPKIVHALTWDNRVNLGLLNHQNQTALDIADRRHHQNPSLAQRLTWNALQSAGATRSPEKKLHPEGMQVVKVTKGSNTEQYKDRIDTLIVVSTLIITASFAAAFTMPGDVDEGTAVNINRHMFHLFILSLTISIYGAINTTIILMWARLGDLRLALFALNCAMPLLGISLTTLSLAFLAGVYLVVGKLSWLATTLMVMCVVMVVVVVLLYTLLWLPSSSTFPFLRYISYYPFIWLAMLAEAQNHKASTSSIQ